MTFPENPALLLLKATPQRQCSGPRASRLMSRASNFIAAALDGRHQFLERFDEGIDAFLLQLLTYLIEIDARGLEPLNRVAGLIDRSI